MDPPKRITYFLNGPLVVIIRLSQPISVGFESGSELEKSLFAGILHRISG